MHTDNKNDIQDQINADLAANIHKAIALWEAKDWTTYKTTRDALLELIRSGRGAEVGIEQMQFIYFINTHLRHRFAVPMPDFVLFKRDLPPTHPIGDKAWNVAAEGAFWAEVL